MKKYVKKPIEIEAFQFGVDDIPDWAFSKINFINNNMKIEYSIETLEGDMKFKEKDYIIKGACGEVYSCKKDIFEATYDEIKYNGSSVVDGYFRAQKELAEKQQRDFKSYSEWLDEHYKDFKNIKK